ncbi:hypothetical protein [Dictyobacter arantiisoli]|uniref:hypothetical protein n=1 Tax=Dictyobacter arantiisoli TaxID=2014874 RepID=UPI0011ECE822|nr:hypothetical protein [Dictyobacter arantiisoli]
MANPSALDYSSIVNGGLRRCFLFLGKTYYHEVAQDCVSLCAFSFSSKLEAACQHHLHCL